MHKKATHSSRTTGTSAPLMALAVAAVLLCPKRALPWPILFKARQPEIKPHPAICRVIATEMTGNSLGTGVLVYKDNTFGIVLTNWHVVRDASDVITVLFPEGLSYVARVLLADRDWDLAALLILAPPIAPLPIASQKPLLGEPLWIAGYGRGQYRLSGGRAVQYVSPGRNLPPDMVELSTPARQGDSGGPILNSRGEVAGILFGSTGTTTIGSHADRLRWFLAQAQAMLPQTETSEQLRIARRPLATPLAPRKSPDPPQAVAGQTFNAVGNPAPISSEAQKAQAQTSAAQSSTASPAYTYPLAGTLRPGPTSGENDRHPRAFSWSGDGYLPERSPNISQGPRRLLQQDSGYYGLQGKAAKNQPVVVSKGREDLRQSPPSNSETAWTTHTPQRSKTRTPLGPRETQQVAPRHISTPPAAISTKTSVGSGNEAADRQLVSPLTQLRNFLAVVGCAFLFIQAMKVLAIMES